MKKTLKVTRRISAGKPDPPAEKQYGDLDMAGAIMGTIVVCAIFIGIIAAIAASH